MIIRILGYDYTICYRPGLELVISRLPNIENKEPVEIEMYQDELFFCEIDHIDLDLNNLSSMKQISTREITTNDRSN